MGDEGGQVKMGTILDGGYSYTVRLICGLGKDGD